MASLSLQHINKTYPNGFQAVKDFNLEIEDKEFIIFVGPSGCGKSTTLRMIAGLEEISGGTLKIGDKVMNDVEPKDRDIAMVFQNYALYPHMTVYDNTLSLTTGKSLRFTIKKFLKVKDSCSFTNCFVDLVFRNFTKFKSECHVIIYCHMRIQSVVLEYHCDITVWKKFPAVH